MPIEAKVAAVLSDAEIAINAGSEHGVKRNDIVTLLREVDVVDPETGEELGTIARPLLRLQVTEVKARFAVAMSIEPAPTAPLDVYFTDRVTTMRITAKASQATDSIVLVQVGFKAVVQSAAPDQPARSLR